MLTEIYVEALLIDEEAADEVWEAWDKGEIDDQLAWLAWRMVRKVDEMEFLAPQFDMETAR